jgi:protein SCO1/2
MRVASRLCAGLLLVVSATAAVHAGPAQSAAAGLVPGHFELNGADGHTYTERSFPDRWPLVFFGFTNCPDICPTTLLAVRHALDELGPAAAKVQPVFITLDPERDSADKLRDYLNHFGPMFMGLTGNERAIHDAARSFRVYLEVRSLSDDAYTVDHSAFLYLLAPDGHFVKLLSADAPGHQLADALRDAVH